MENKLIVDAIRRRKILKFNYKRKSCYFEAYSYGYDKHNDDLLFGILTVGTNIGWETIHVSEIESLSLTNSFFFRVDVKDIPSRPTMLYTYKEWPFFPTRKK